MRRAWGAVVLLVLVACGGDDGVTQADVDAVQEQLDAAEGERDEATERVAELEDDLAAAEDAVEQVDDREAELDAREAELEEIRAGLDDIAAQLLAREEAVTAAETRVAANSFSDGIYQVGADIEPGTYRTEGGSNCYYAELAADASDIIDNNLPDGPATAVIDSPFFETSGCGTWTKVG